MADRNPVLKINFFEDIESTGAKEGFTKLSSTPRGYVANYNNYGRFTFDSLGPIVMMKRGATPGGIPYSEYRENPEEWEDRIRIEKWGFVSFVNLKDVDNGHTVTLWMNSETDKNNELTGKLDWFGEMMTDFISKYGITEENKDDHVFEIGKEPSKMGSMGKRYLNYIGTMEDLTLLENPNAYSQEKKSKMIENQTKPQGEAKLENFELNEDEVFLVKQLDQLAENGKLSTVTESRLASTLESGYGNKKTTKPRAAYIAKNAADFFTHLEVDG